MKTYLFLLCILTQIIQLSAQTTAIPDPNFEQKLISLGIDSDGILNGQILNSDADSVSSLNISYSNIDSLTGIAAFINLTVLNCSNNNISILDVSNNTSLNRLHCSNNNIIILDISNNTSLNNLYCRNNNISNLDISNNTSLNDLDCLSNNISTLDVSNNTYLFSLNCSINNISALDVSNNTYLDDLECYANQLSTLDVSNNTDLTFLGCSSNQLSTLDVSNNTDLDYLGCSSNQLSTLDVSNNTDLTSLRCGSNQLSTLDVSNNTDLGYMNCDSNQLSKLDLRPIINLRDFQSLGNDPLLEICVTDTTAALNNSNWLKDNSAQYVENCIIISTKSLEAAQVVQIYPNPTTTGQLNVEQFSTTEVTLSLYNISGQKLLEKQTTEQLTTLNLGNYPAGAYILQVQTAKGTENYKVIHQ